MVIRIFVFLLLWLAVIPIGASESDDIDFSKVEDRLNRMESIIPVVQMDEVKTRINRHLRRDNIYTLGLIERSFMYFPIIEDMLEENGLPDEVKYLTVIESELNSNVQSHVGASGFWQLMPRTAISLGIAVNSEIDERYDLFASTEAAIAYLKQLYEVYEDWSLVLAAYNRGPSKVNQLIRQTGSKNLRGIYPHLPKETRDYFDRFLAYKYVFEYYKDHHINPDSRNTSIVLSRHSYPLGTSLKTIAQRCDIELSELQSINPHIRLTPTKKIDKAVSLILPYDRDFRLKGSYQLDSFYLEDWTEEELSEIAEIIGCSKRHIFQWNSGENVGIGRVRKIKILVPHQRIAALDQWRGYFDYEQLPAIESRIDRRFDAGEWMLSLPKGELDSHYVQYSLTPYDDLKKVAYKYGVTVESLLAENETDSLGSGSIIRIPLD